MNKKVAMQNLSSSIDSATTSLKRAFSLGTADYFIEAFQFLNKRIQALESASQEFQDAQLYDKTLGLRNLVQSVANAYETKNEESMDLAIKELEARALDLKNYVSIQDDNFEQQFSEINNY